MDAGSLILTLPTEIWVTIFKIVHETDQSPKTTYRHLSQICRHWHSIATPLLWNTPVIRSSKAFRDLARNASETPFAGYLKSLVLPLLPEPSRCDSSISISIQKLLKTPKIHLRHLDISFCKGVTNTALINISPYLDNLISLNVSGSGRSDHCLKQVLEQCKNTLKSLNISWNGSVTDATMAFIGLHCFALRDLNVSGCPRITDVGVMALSCNLIRHIPLLSLNMSERPAPRWSMPVKPLVRCQSDQAIKSTFHSRGISVTNLRPCSLDVLNISCCNHVTVFSLQHLRESCQGRIQIQQS